MDDSTGTGEYEPGIVFKLQQADESPVFQAEKVPGRI